MSGKPMADETHGKATNISVRRANPRDKTAVLRINDNVYNGMDYLPYLYDSLILDENYTYYVAEVDTTVVAFYGVCLIDGGKTLMARSGRVRADFEGQGLLGQILRKVHQDFLPLHHVTPDLKMAIALGDSCALINRAKFRSISELVWTRHQRVVQTSDFSRLTTVQPPKASHCASPSVKELSHEEFIHLVSSMDSGHRQCLFPGDVFTSFTWHFRADQLAASRQVWGKWDPHFSLSSSLEDNILQPGVSGTKDASPKPCHDSQAEGSYSGLLLSSMITGTPSGPVVFLDFFGKVLDGEDLRGHLSRLLSGVPSRLMKMGLEVNRVILLIYTNRQEEAVVIIKELKLLGFEEVDYVMKKMHYFWQNFETLKTS